MSGDRGHERIIFFKQPCKKVRHNLIIAQWRTRSRKTINQVLDTLKVVEGRQILFLRRCQLHVNLHGAGAGFGNIEAVKFVPHLFGCFQDQTLAQNLRGQR
jgi:hypothetical protein